MIKYHEQHTNIETDKKLWAALRNGHNISLEKLYQRHYTLLYNYGMKIVNNRTVVIDSIQQLFLILWQSHSRLGKAKSVKGYLLCSLRRLILSELKKIKSNMRLNRNYFDCYEEEVSSVEEHIIEKENIRYISELLQKATNDLTARQREVIISKYFNGCNDMELTTLLELNYQCVRNLHSQALNRLRSNMKIWS